MVNQQIIDTLSYVPLNKTTIFPGQYFGPHKYYITSISHEHHLGYLKRHNHGNIFPFSNDFLFPFELFSLPRVLTQSGGYKRLNEIISVFGERIVYKLPEPNELLLGDVLVENIFIKNDLCFGYFNSTTRLTNGGILMKSTDKLILVNGSNKQKLKALIEKSKGLKTFISKTEKAILINSFTLSFRHQWDETIWKNNIHTDVYAKSLGYEKGLIEAPCLVDAIISNAAIGKYLKENSKISWEYFSALYNNLDVDLKLVEGSTGCLVYICETINQNILMKLTITNYEK